MTEQGFLRLIERSRALAGAWVLTLYAALGVAVQAETALAGGCLPESQALGRHAFRGGETPPAPGSTSAGALASLLAGNPPTTVPEPHRGIIGEHGRKLEAVFAPFHERRQRRIRDWSDQELCEVRRRTTTVFYPFSGPDVIYPLTFFPNADLYLLTALEPVLVTPVPNEMSAEGLGAYLEAIRRSLEGVYIRTYFRTTALDADLPELGVVPIMLLQLAREGHEVTRLEPVELSPEGQLVASDWRGRPGQALGVAITFKRRSAARDQVVIYLQEDLVDGELAETAPLAVLLQRVEALTTYLKAASYLLHRSGFSTLRRLITHRSDAILQDDSGLPIDLLPADVWNLQLYGEYEAPIEFFSDFTQRRLREMFATPGAAKALDFGIGYRFEYGANLLLATRRTRYSSPNGDRAEDQLSFHR